MESKRHPRGSRFYFFSASLLVAILLCSVPFFSQVPAKKDSKIADKMHDGLWILTAGWTSKIPPAGSVNAPGQIRTLAPGQGFAIGLVLEGENREQLLDGRTLVVKISTSAGVFEKRDIKPLAVRRIKATGADMVRIVLEASGIDAKEKDKVEKLTTVLSMAVYECGWEAPNVPREELVHIEARLVGGKEPISSLKATDVTLRPWSDWATEPEPGDEVLSGFMGKYYDSPRPGLLLPMLKTAVHSDRLNQAPCYSFFVAAFRECPQAKQEAIKAYDALDLPCQGGLLLILRLLGEDVSSMLATIPESARGFYKGVEPLQDPRAFTPFTDPIDPQVLAQVGVPMDECWGSWMATGDSSYVRSLVGLLAGAPNYKTLQSWIKEKGGEKELNARVASGLAYMVAGWSLSSFQRTDPRVADWLSYWQQDATIPALLREEIKLLPTNPAFQRDKEK